MLAKIDAELESHAHELAQIQQYFNTQNTMFRKFTNSIGLTIPDDNRMLRDTHDDDSGYAFNITTATVSKKGKAVACMNLVSAKVKTLTEEPGNTMYDGRQTFSSEIIDRVIEQLQLVRQRETSFKYRIQQIVDSRDEMRVIVEARYTDLIQKLDIYNFDYVRKKNNDL